MTSRKQNNLIILMVLAVYIVYYRVYLLASDLVYSEFVNITAIIIIAFVTILLLGFRKDKLTELKKQILTMTITEIVLFFCISYGLGFVTGFLKNAYALDIKSIFENTVSPILYIVSIEIFRYAILNANKDKKSVLIITTILITILELMMGLDGVLMYNFETIFKATSSIVIPVIIKNAVLSYLIINGGLRPVLVYRLVMDGYGYVMPIIPDLGEYLISVIGIILPTLIYMYSSRLVDDRNRVLETEYKKKSIKISDIPIILFIIVLVVLISGKFTYAIIGVGSGSMSPKIEKGDAVIYKQVKAEKDIEVGDVIVFKSGSKIIIHRLVGIKEEEGTKYYITKGDANNANDAINLTIDNVKGKVLFPIKYLAYPNLLLKDILDKE